jgi:hypothetical protein
MQQTELNTGVTLVVVLLAFGAMVLFLGITGLICYLAGSALKAIPEEHRKMDPAMVWLLMIPCFGVIWNFFVFQRIPASFQSYFASQGRTDVGDCGKTLGLWYAIICILSAVPGVSMIAGPAALVLLILNLVKYSELKKKVLQIGGTPPAPAITQ